MKNLNLKIQGGYELRPIVEIDGKVVAYKRNKHKNIEINHQTENSSVKLTLRNVLEIKGPYWWLVQMAFFILSCFGIFNPRLEKFCYNIHFCATLELSEGENDVLLKFNYLKDGARAIEFVSDNKIVEDENKYVVDSEAKKRKKILLASRLVAWAILAAGIILGVVLSIK